MASEITLEQFMDLTSNGRIFGVDFIKRSDNTVRSMRARRGVSKGVKGTGQSYTPGQRQLLTVYDMAKLDPKAAHNAGKSADEMTRGAFRNINLDGLVSVRLGGQRYDWNAQQQSFLKV
jgi:hypothetical protein